MRMCNLSSVSRIEISNVNKKTKEGEKEVKLCNFTDVYYNWSINNSIRDGLMKSTANDNQIQRFSIKKGDVAITKDSETRDDIGVSTYIDLDDDDIVLGYHCALISPDETVLLGSYLNIILHSAYAQKYFEMNASGSGQRYTLTTEIIGGFPVPIIDINLQRKIGEVFDNIEKKIIINETICNTEERLAQTLYDYWFTQFDFPDEFGRPYKANGGKMVWNEEIKKEIPEGWEITTVGEITNCLDSKRIPVSSKDRAEMQGDIPYYGATGIMGYVDRPIFDGEYVLLAEDGSIMDEEGFPIIQRVSGKVWINNHAHVLEPKEGYSCKLLMHILKYIPVIQIKTGSIQMKITQDNLNGYKIVNIPAYLRKQINEKLVVIDNTVLQLRRENSKLKALRNYLIPLVIGGQIK